MMTPRERICYCFEKGLTCKADDKFVRVQAVDLLTAFGESVVEKEFGATPKKISDTVTTAKVARVLELQNEIEELSDMLEAGFEESRKELKLAKRELQMIEEGRLLPKPLVSVEVGKLRRLVDDVRNITRAEREKRKNTPTGEMVAKLVKN